MKTTTRMLAAALAAAALLTGCSGGSAGTATAAPTVTVAEPVGLLTVAASDARDVIADRTGQADFVVLDVRTPAEYAAGRLADSVNIDFYASDFRSRLAELDPDVTYVLYCNSGNRSGTTLQLMEDLGFRSVYEVDGGIQSWMAGGHPVCTDC